MLTLRASSYTEAGRSTSEGTFEQEQPGARPPRPKNCHRNHEEAGISDPSDRGEDDRSGHGERESGEATGEPRCDEQERRTPDTSSDCQARRTVYLEEKPLQVGTVVRENVGVGRENRGVTPDRREADDRPGRQNHRRCADRGQHGGSVPLGRDQPDDERCHEQLRRYRGGQGSCRNSRCVSPSPQNRDEEDYQDRGVADSKCGEHHRRQQPKPEAAEIPDAENQEGRARSSRHEQQPRGHSGQEQLGGLLGTPGLEQRRGERPGGVAGEDAFVEFLRDVGALLCSGERQLDVAGGERGEAAVEEVPGKPLDVVQQTSGLDSAVEHLPGLRHAALHPERCPEHREDEREGDRLARSRARSSRHVGRGGPRPRNGRGTSPPSPGGRVRQAAGPTPRRTVRR